MCGVRVDVAAAIGPQHLDRDLRSYRSLHNRLRLGDLLLHDRLAVRAFDRLALVVLLLDLSVDGFGKGGGIVRLEVLNDPLGDEHQREDEANREQQIISGSHQIDPEVADGFGCMTSDAANQRRRDADPDRGRDEIVDGQRDHLRQVGHGAFTAVALPVGVRGETGRSVESEMLAQRGELLRIQRQVSLQPQDEVSEDHRNEAEEQHRHGVLFPIVLPAGIHAQHAVGEPLQGLEHRIEDGLAVRVQYLAKVKAKGLGDRQQEADVE